MNELALFAGAGGGILGGHLLGWRTLCGVERDAFAAGVLAQRQNDACLAPFPVWSDVTTFDGRRWRGRVSVVSGGFPCQDISVAGNGDGLDGARSGLWREFARIIGEVLPEHALVENSPALTTRGGVRVIGDLARMGFDCRWGIVSAADAIWLAGAPCLDHLRERIWIAATRTDADSRRREEQWLAELGRIEGARGGFAYGLREDWQQYHAAGTNAVGSGLQNWPTGSGMPCPRGTEIQPFGDSAVADADRHGIRKQPKPESGSSCAALAGAASEASADSDRAGFEQQRSTFADGPEHQAAERGGWWAAEPDVGRMADGVANRVDRLKCTGNGQVPAVVRLAWRILSNPT
jgi:DNA (cytosine-5)-methyltransferase 1